MSKRSAARATRLGDVLVRHRLITPAQRRHALRRQRETGRRLGEILVAEGILTRDQLNWALGNLLHIPYVHPDADAIAPELFQGVDLGLLRRCAAVPMARLGGKLTVAMADPTDTQAISELSAAFGLPISVAMADSAAIQNVLDKVAERGALRDLDAALRELLAACTKVVRLIEAWRAKGR